MFFKFLSSYLIIIKLFILCFLKLAIAQDKKQMLQQADQLFQKQNFTESMQLYSQLLSLNPRDPFISYRFGVSMLYADRRDINKAIQYIKKGEDFLENDDKILYFYHLAQAYHFSYRFREAIENYLIFKQLAQNNSKYHTYDVDRQIQMCHNGLLLLKNMRKIFVFDKQHVGQAYFFRSYDMSRFHGKILAKPEALKTKYDKKKNDQSLVFLSDTQQVIFFSSYGKDGTYQRDIFMSYRTASGWSSPIRLPEVINTLLDEDYPYLAPDGKTLYFCSKGHSSMGGYDIYYSRWDETHKEWSKAINLDFPINTPFNDILFVTDANMEYAYFASDRGSTVGKIHTYLIRIDIIPKLPDIETMMQVIENPPDENNYLQIVEQIQSIASMDVNASREQFQKPIQQFINPVFADNFLYGLSDNPTESEIIQKTFELLSETEKNLLRLKQRRESAELLLSKNNYQSRYHSQQAQLTAKQIENTPEQKKKLEQQYEYHKQMSLAHQTHAEHMRTAISNFDRAIKQQDRQLQRIQAYAGYIQILASAQKIDTSVVILKKMMQEVHKFDINTYNSITFNYPLPEDIRYLEYQINEIEKKIQAIDRYIKQLSDRISPISENNDSHQLFTEDNKQHKLLIKEALDNILVNRKFLEEQRVLLNEALSQAQGILMTDVSIMMDEAHLAFQVITENKNREAFIQNTDLLKNESESHMDQIFITESKTDASEQQNLKIQDNVNATSEIYTNDKQLATKELQHSDNNMITVKDTITNPLSTTKTNIELKNKLINDYSSKNELQKKELLVELISSNINLAEKVDILNDIIKLQQQSILSERAILNVMIDKRNQKITAYNQNLQKLSEAQQKQSYNSSEMLINHLEWYNNLTQYCQIIQEIDILEGINASVSGQCDVAFNQWQTAQGIIENIESYLFSNKLKKAQKELIKFSQFMEKNTNLWVPNFFEVTPTNQYIITLQQKINNDKISLQQKMLQLDHINKQLSKAEHNLQQSRIKSQQNHQNKQYEKLIEQKHLLENEIANLKHTIESNTHRLETFNQNINNFDKEKKDILQNSYLTEVTYLTTFKNIPTEPNKMQNDVFSPDFMNIVSNQYNWKQSTEVYIDLNYPDTLQHEMHLPENTNQEHSIKTANEIFEYITYGVVSLYIRKIQLLDEQLKQAIDNNTTIKLLQQRQDILDKLANVLQNEKFLEKLHKIEELPELKEIDKYLFRISVLITLLENQKQQLLRSDSLNYTDLMKMIKKFDDNIIFCRKQLEYLTYLRQLYLTQLNTLLLQLLMQEEKIKLPNRKAILDNIESIQQSLTQLLFLSDNAEQIIDNKQRFLSYQTILDSIIIRKNHLEDIIRQYDTIDEDNKANLKITVRKLSNVQNTLQKDYRELLAEANNLSDNDSQNNLLSNNSEQKSTIFSSVSDDSKTSQNQHQRLIISDKPVSSDFYNANISDSPIAIREEVHYKVQFIALKRQADANQFAQLQPVYEEYANGLFKYLHGDYTNYQLALRARDSIRSIGFRDAFIVTYNSKKQIQVTESRNLQQTFLHQSTTLSSSSQEQLSHVSTSNTKLPQGFYFVVQVGVFARPRTSHQLYNISPLFEEKMENGYYRYYTGAFISYDEALNVQQTLRSSYVPDAFIVAIKDGKKISVHEARQLINSGTSAWIKQPIQTDESSINFAVQLGVFEKEVNSETAQFFNILCNQVQILEEEQKYIYYCGLFKSYDDAKQQRDSLIQLGLSDVFIIAIKDQKKIPISEVLQNR